jgi:hypothetical protein
MPPCDRTRTRAVSTLLASVDSGVAVPAAVTFLISGVRPRPGVQQPDAADQRRSLVAAALRGPRDTSWRLSGGTAYTTSLRVPAILIVIGLALTVFGARLALVAVRGSRGRPTPRTD